MVESLIGLEDESDALLLTRRYRASARTARTARSDGESYFEFKRDSYLTEHPTDLRRETKAVHGGGGDRHEQTDIGALRANSAQQCDVRLMKPRSAQAESPGKIPGYRGVNHDL
jgi:hypothetical protein